VLPALPLDLDLDRLSRRSNTRHISVPHGFARQDLHSHVLLAACSAAELAYETEGSGDFTAALIKPLKKYGAVKTTYKGCIHRFPTLQKYVHGLPSDPSSDVMNC
jgi:hypothetical protein